MAYNIAYDIAQTLADHLDDLRETGEGVTCYAEDTGLGNVPEEHLVSEVTDAEKVPELANVQAFYTVVRGRRFLVHVVETQR